MQQMVDMELTDDEKHDFVAPIAVDTPKYPYGLRICLSQDEIAKLGIDPEEAVVGGYFTLHAICCVTSVSSDETETGKRFRMEAQIEKMAVDSDAEETGEGENGGAQVAGRRSRLYTKAAAY